MQDELEWVGAVCVCVCVCVCVRVCARALGGVDRREGRMKLGE